MSRPPGPPPILRAAFRAAAFLVVVALGAPPVPASADPPEGGTVSRVVDGDTLRVASRGGLLTVRLVGIDAPEKAHPSKSPQFLSAEAAAFLSSLCRGRPVVLVRDREDADRHGRLLRYVFLADAATSGTAPGDPGLLLNLEMVRQGLARVMRRFPFARRDEFLRAETAARGNGLGIWKDGGLAEARWLHGDGGPGVRVYPDSGGRYAVVFGDLGMPWVPGRRLPGTIDTILRIRAESSDAEFAARAAAAGFRPLGPAPPGDARRGGPAPAGGASISWEEVDRYAGSAVTVTGRIVGTHRGKSAVYLNFHPNWKRYLTVVIPLRALAAFPADPASLYGGRLVRVRGTVRADRGRPEIVVTDPRALVVEPETPGR